MFSNENFKIQRHLKFASLCFLIQMQKKAAIFINFIFINTKLLYRDKSVITSQKFLHITLKNLDPNFIQVLSSCILD